MSLIQNIKIIIGFFIILLLFFGTIISIYALTSHKPTQIIPGIFTGNYTFNGKVKINGSLNISNSTLVGKEPVKFANNFTQIMGPITYHSITPIDNITLNQELPDNTKAIRIAVYYIQGAHTASTYGYWSFNTYQDGEITTDYRSYYRSHHYNDYFNSDYVEILVPWNPNGRNNLIINTTDSYNTDSLNEYFIYYLGYIAG